MGNNSLIQGASRSASKFLDIGSAIGEGFDDSSGSDSTPYTVKKNNEYQNAVNGYIGKMKTDMDFTSLSNTETASIRNFLLAERGKYTDAAKKIGSIDDKSSSEYLEGVDVMNSVNNSFTNLAAQLDAYKKSRLSYAEDQMGNSLSKGMDPAHNKQSMIMYGFYDKDGDKVSDARYDAPFKILGGGNIGFDIEGSVVSFNDAPAPIYKDYKAANSILKTNEAVHKSGQLMTKTEGDMYRLQLQEALQDPNSLKSIVYDFENELSMGDIGNLWDKEKNNPGSLERVRGMVIDRLIKARYDVSKGGYEENLRKKASKNQGARTKKEDNSSVASTYADPYVKADGKWYTYKIGKNNMAVPDSEFETAPPAGAKNPNLYSDAAETGASKATKKTVKKEDKSFWSYLFGTKK